MVSIGISEFRANMSAIFQRVQQGEVISLLMRDKEIARLVPLIMHGTQRDKNWKNYAKQQ